MLQTTSSHVMYLFLHNRPSLSTVVSQNKNHFVCSWSNGSAIWPVFGCEDAVIWPLSVSIFSKVALLGALLVSLVFLSIGLPTSKVWFSHIEAPYPKRVEGARLRVESHKTLSLLNSVGHNMSQGQPRFKNVKIDSILYRRSWKGGGYRNERDYCGHICK